MQFLQPVPGNLVNQPKILKAVPDKDSVRANAGGILG
jgi:hypothetical protein